MVGIGVESTLLVVAVGNRNVIWNEVGALVNRASHIILERYLGIAADSKGYLSLAVKEEEAGTVGLVEVHVLLVIEHGYQTSGRCSVAGQNNGTFGYQKCVGILAGMDSHCQRRHD